MDSAAGTAKTARNRATQAILPVRGKILNTEGMTLAKALENQEIKDMIYAFGLNISADGKTVEYDESKLRYHKICTLTDADVDGSHIAILFLTFIWTFVPQLILDGHIYVCVSPLYKITIGKESLYLKDDYALEQYQKLNKGKKYTINRFKGYEIVWPLSAFPLIRGVA